MNDILYVNFNINEPTLSDEEKEANVLMDKLLGEYIPPFRHMLFNTVVESDTKIISINKITGRYNFYVNGINQIATSCFIKTTRTEFNILLYRGEHLTIEYVEQF